MNILVGVKINLTKFNSASHEAELAARLDYILNANTQADQVYLRRRGEIPKGCSIFAEIHSER